MRVLYKYCSLKNFRHFADIIVESRLYAANYKDLNDPMEGQYYYSNNGQFSSAIFEKLAAEKERKRICSLTRDPDNKLMWAHYANGARGTIIEVNIDDSDNDIELPPITYSVPEISSEQELLAYRAIDMLSHKHEVWNYEQEERVFTNNKFHFPVTVQKVIIGEKMSQYDSKFTRDFINKVNSEITIISSSAWSKM